MRQRFGRIVLLTAFGLLFMASYVWAVQPVRFVPNLGTARAVAHYIMGYRAELKGNIDVAQEEYAQSVRYDATSFVSHMRLAMAYAQGNHFAEAIGVAEAAVNLNTQDLGVHYFLALLYSQLRQDNKSRAEYELIFKSLALKNPGNSEFLIYLGQLYYSSGKKLQAMEQFAAALKLDPKNCDLLYLLGSFYLDTEKRGEGLKLIQQCLVVDPDNADCLNSLAYSYAEDNVKLDEALGAINAALKIEPNNAAYLDTLGWLYYRQGSFDKALQALLRANSLIKDPTILEHIAEVYQSLGQSVEAIKYQTEKEQVINAKNKKAAR